MNYLYLAPFLFVFAVALSYFFVLRTVKHDKGLSYLAMVYLALLVVACGMFMWFLYCAGHEMCPGFGGSVTQ